MTQAFTLSVLGETFAVSKLERGTHVPFWATSADWWSVTTTSDELFVCPENKVPIDITSNRGWKCLKVIGPLPFSLTGVLFSQLKPLAEARISVFTLSTFDTDYLLVKTQSLAATVNVLSLAGHRVLV